jgi:O-antigen/teichoic acid export membrane protein
MMERVESADARPSGRLLARGAGALGMVGVIKMGLQAVTLPIMAHLLGPSEIGVYALAIPVVAFVTMLADGGLGISLAREPETSRVWSTAFWVLLLTGIVLGLLLSLAGLAEGYITRQPRVPGIMSALSVTVVLLTVSAPSLARLDRQGRIAVGAFADLAGNLVGAALGVALAFHGAGAWSMVAQYLTLFFVRAAIINAVAFTKPKFEFQPRLLLTHISTGGLVVGTRMADYFGRMVENLLVGQGLGTASLGRYSIANQITRYLSDMVGNPLWMTLYIRALRADRQETAGLQLQFSRILGAVLFPIAAFAMASAPRLVPVLLGSKWVTAIPLIQILLPAYVVSGIASLSGAPLLAMGRYELQFYGQAGLSGGRVLAVCLGPWIGLTGIAYGVSVVTAIYALTMLVLPATVTGCRPLPALRNLLDPFVASLVLGLVCWLILRQAPPSFLRVGLASVLGAVAYFSVCLVIGRARLMQDFRLLKQLLLKPG